MIDGDEYDALTRGGRRVLAFRPGERAWIKRKYRRRERHQPIPDEVDRDGYEWPATPRRCCNREG
jgi:hypothetical protein